MILLQEKTNPYNILVVGKGFQVEMEKYVYIWHFGKDAFDAKASKRFMSNATLEVTHSYHFSHLKAKRAKVT